MYPLYPLSSPLVSLSSGLLVLGSATRVLRHVPCPCPPPRTLCCPEGFDVDPDLLERPEAEAVVDWSWAAARALRCPPLGADVRLRGMMRGTPGMLLPPLLELSVSLSLPVSSPLPSPSLP